jgi:hypothetical protein
MKHRKNRRKLSKFQLFCAVVALLIVVASQVFCMTVAVVAIIEMIFFNEMRAEVLALYIHGLVLMVTVWCFTTGKVVHPIIYTIVAIVRNKIYPNVNDSQNFGSEEKNE